MKTNTRNILIKSAVALALAAPMLANAESQFTTGAGSPITATAHLDFQITIPKVLFLQVGTGTAGGNNATVNQIAFTVPGANLGDSSVINASVASGDLGNGTVTAKVIGNNGTITFTSTTAGPLGNGAGDTISFAQIATAVATLTSATALAHPALADGASLHSLLRVGRGALIGAFGDSLV